MSNFKTKLSVALLVALPLCAGAAVPGAGLKAEGEQRWDDAVKIYRQALQENPRQVELWLRIADIQAHLGNQSAVLEALSQAARYAPRNADVAYRLSQAHAQANNPPQAMEAINRAVELSPRNVEYLQARGNIANWNSDYPTAQDSYRRILALQPNNHEARLLLARSSMWAGDFDTAATAYKAYLRARPDDRDATLEAMEAEAERGNYDGALSYGERYRQRFGESFEYWLRVADLYALSGNDKASADALQKAASYAPDDAALQYRIASSYTRKEDVPMAMKALDRALELDPDNIQYLRSRSDLASWIGDYDTALESNYRILKIAPGDPGAMLAIARLKGWQGKSGEAIDAYESYLAKHPDVQLPWVEYIKLVTEIGDYPRAMELLADYRKRFGDNEAYWKLKARALAWANRPESALPITTRLLQGSPDDYEVNYTRTVALNNDHRPREAVASLDILRRIDEDKPDTDSLERYITTPLRSHVDLSGGYWEDSDDVVIRRLGLEGTYVASPETRYFLGGEQTLLEAPIGSGLENIDGTKDAEYMRYRLGFRHLVSPDWSLDAWVGEGRVDDNEGEVVYQVGADIWPHDELTLRLFHEHDLYAVSPRAASLDIYRSNTQLNASWSPTLRDTVDMMVAGSTFSDDNSRWDVQLAPRHAILRSAPVNVDLGVSGQWFGFDTDPGNGYYAPSQYERYALTAFTYWKLSENDAISLTFSAGGYKDDTMGSYEFSGDVTAEGYFGIYRDWYLDVRAGLFENSGYNTGAYRAGNIDFVLTRRF